MAGATEIGGWQKRQINEQLEFNYGQRRGLYAFERQRGVCSPFLALGTFCLILGLEHQGERIKPLITASGESYIVK
jgi:hypothetical protein